MGHSVHLGPVKLLSVCLPSTTTKKGNVNVAHTKDFLQLRLRTRWECPSNENTIKLRTSIFLGLYSTWNVNDHIVVFETNKYNGSHDNTQWNWLYNPSHKFIAVAAVTSCCCWHPVRHYNLRCLLKHSRSLLSGCVQSHSERNTLILLSCFFLLCLGLRPLQPCYS